MIAVKKYSLPLAFALLSTSTFVIWLHLQISSDAAQKNLAHESAVEKIVHLDAPRTQGEDNESCWRQCPKRINKIYYIDVPAGLNDRITVIRDLAQIAGYLCATLEFPPPSKLLNPRHNNFEWVSSSVRWSDLYNLTFIQDSSPVMNDDPFPPDFTSWYEPSSMYDNEKYANWLHVVSTNGELVEDYAKLQKFSFLEQDQQSGDDKAAARKGFIWEIHTHALFSSDFYKNKLPKIPSESSMLATKFNKPRYRPYLFAYSNFHKVNEAKRKGCVYTDSDTDVDNSAVPSHMGMMGKRLIHRIQRQSRENTVYGYLHLRRGDTIDTCDTSVGEIRNFLSCSLAGTEKVGKNITLLLGSDEEDENYRWDVMDLAKDYNHVQILDADKIALSVVKQAASTGIIDEGLANNFYVYRVHSIMKNKLSSFELVKRKASRCPVCVPLMKWEMFG